MLLFLLLNILAPFYKLAGQQESMELPKTCYTLVS